MKEEDLPELDEKETAAAILEGRVKKHFHQKAVARGDGFVSVELDGIPLEVKSMAFESDWKKSNPLLLIKDELSEVVSFSPETNELLKRAKQINQP